MFKIISMQTCACI